MCLTSAHHLSYFRFVRIFRTIQHHHPHHHFLQLSPHQCAHHRVVHHHSAAQIAKNRLPPFTRTSLHHRGQILPRNRRQTPKHASAQQNCFYPTIQPKSRFDLCRHRPKNLLSQTYFLQPRHQLSQKQQISGLFSGSLHHIRHPFPHFSLHHHRLHQKTHPTQPVLCQRSPLHTRYKEPQARNHTTRRLHPTSAAKRQRNAQRAIH